MIFVAQAYETSLTITPPNSIYDFDNGTYTFTNSSGTFTVNGSDTSFAMGEQNLILGIDATEGIMIAIIAVGALVAVVGIKVLDSGLSDYSQKGIVNFSVYGAFWGIFFLTVHDFIILAEVVGWFIFFLISVLHFFGIMQVINGD